MNGSFFFREGEEGTRIIELLILPHGEVEVEETFVIELNILSGDMDIDPQAGSVTLKVLNLIKTVRLSHELQYFLQKEVYQHSLLICFCVPDREVW